MLPITKLYVDSRFKSSDSTSDSDFKIDIPINLLTPENTGFYIDDVSIPVSWYTIDANRNNKIRFSFVGVLQMVEVPPGNYSLVTHPQHSDRRRHEQSGCNNATSRRQVSS